MIQLGSCSRCGGFLALALRACPHCEAKVPLLSQLALGAATVLGGGAVSMTLMACYGPACVDEVCSGADPDLSQQGDGSLATAETVLALQADLPAGTWAGSDADGECTVEASGGADPLRLYVTVTGSGGRTRSVEIVEAVTPIEERSSDGSVRVNGEWLRVIGEDGAPTQVTLGDLTCADLTRR